ncbi:hypothetical protein AB0O01_25710 [Streptomyces sp. NPDC093252]|uniref:anti-sigma factor family protein n=1 Tax=Streptomyces sp. NPDC093252 TaxID=3154980 RepID=UPI003429CC88
MTSTTDMTEHPDVSEIADLTEGLLTRSRSADLHQHLDICTPCADVYASLEEIRGLLGTMPEPPAMPADIAERIDQALAAEAALQGSPGNGTHVSRETPDAATVSRETSPLTETSLSPPTDTPSSPVPEPPSSPLSEAPSPLPESAPSSLPEPSPSPLTETSPHVSRETSTTSDRPAGQPRPSTSGPGRKRPDRARRRRVTVIGAAFAAAAVGLGTVLLSSLMGGPSGPQTNGDPTTTAADTFSAESLERQVTDLLARDLVQGETMEGGGDPRTPMGSAEVGGDVGSPRVLQTPSVPDCVRSGIGHEDPALAVDEGVYKGTDAMLVVLPDANDAGRVAAYIMDSTCIKRASTEIAKILFQTSYAHP